MTASPSSSIPRSAAQASTGARSRVGVGGAEDDRAVRARGGAAGSGRSAALTPAGSANETSASASPAASSAGGPSATIRPGGEHRDPIGEPLRLLHVVGGEQDRLALVAQPAISSQERRRASGSKPVVGSSRIDQVGVADDAEREVEAPPLAAREGRRSGRRACRRARRARPARRSGGGASRRRRRGRPPRGRVRSGSRPLSWRTIPIRSRRPTLVALGVGAEHLDLAAAARPVALEDLDDRRLAGAVRAEQPEDGAARDLEVDPPNRLVVAVGLSQTRTSTTTSDAIGGRY